MDFNVYIQRIDGAIKELTDLRSQVIQSQTDFTAGKCVPVVPESPKYSDCHTNPIFVSAEGNEPTFDEWFQAAVNRLKKPLESPGKSQ